MQHAAGSRNYNRMRLHIDHHVTTPVRGFLDRLWTDARAADRRLHKHPWGSADDLGPPSVATWPLCSISGQLLTYSSWKPGERHVPDGPDPASASGSVPQRPTGVPTVATHKQLRLRGVPQQRMADGGALALLALRTLAETRPECGVFTPRQIQLVSGLGVCHFPHTGQHLATCWQCRYYAAHMAIIRANMVVELDASTLFQLPRSHRELAVGILVSNCFFFKYEKR
jgi:hypothetical protein